MSFSLDVKTEMCRLDIVDICCAKSELAGILCFGALIMPGNVKFRTESAVIADRFYHLIKFVRGIEIDVKLSDNGVFIADIQGGDVTAVLRGLRLDSVPIRINKRITAAPCCKIAFVRGAFLGGGSVSNPNKSYHAEIATSHFALLPDFINILNYFDIYPKRITRKGNYILYLKDSEQIENLLAAVGAHTRMMDFVNVKIEKEIRNTINRKVNCDSANFDKIVNAAVAQTLAIEKVKTKNLSPELAEVAELRLKNPEMPLSEMAAILGITKSGVNHRMRRIMEMAE